MRIVELLPLAKSGARVRALSRIELEAETEGDRNALAALHELFCRERFPVLKRALAEASERLAAEEF